MLGFLVVGGRQKVIGLTTHATHTLIALCSLTLLLQVLWLNGHPEIMTYLAIMPGKVNTLYSTVTSLFLHASPYHLLVNMLVLAAVGPAVEARLGWWRFLGLFLLCGIVGNIVALQADSLAFSIFDTRALIKPEDFAPKAYFGVSAADFGIAAAYTLLRGKQGRLYSLVGLGVIPVLLTLPAPIVMTVQVALEILPVWVPLGDPRAHLPHLAGFATGLTVAFPYAIRVLGKHLRQPNFAYRDMPDFVEMFRWGWRTVTQRA